MAISTLRIDITDDAIARLDRLVPYMRNVLARYGPERRTVVREAIMRSIRSLEADEKAEIERHIQAKMHADTVARRLAASEEDRAQDRVEYAED